jgi:ribose 5-phosphate isomerase B
VKFAIGSDAMSGVVDQVTFFLRETGHEVTVLPLAGWADAASDVAALVGSGEADRGVVFCWTGTGASIAANKVRGVRAALCVDAATAVGARKWNDANVLALSLRLTSAPVAAEIVNAFVVTEYQGTEDENLARIAREEDATIS